MDPRSSWHFSYGPLIYTSSLSFYEDVYILQVAFAEGYQAKDKDGGGQGNNPLSKKLMTFFLWGFGIYLIIQIFSIFSAVSTGRSVPGLGVLSADRYEINPEDITVNFSDVKGVSGISVLCSLSLSFFLSFSPSLCRFSFPSPFFF